ncbi:LAME_0G16314g1_1 [Lachancea meyersii CBS 8951]|uniref:LAME_0G16314g1_1 n=1 Tax=Lachancea meyersii CBS 8951 TaxID=1266667 RepID=A0A1G4KB02_9SACH|nr:LAME_0G16314g1_1 [Lachancea meyersii CBS 8951]
MGSPQLSISGPTPVKEGSFTDQLGSLRSEQSSDMNGIKSTLVSKIQNNKGLFTGEVQWCSNLSLDDWKTHRLEIDTAGGLCHAVSRESMADLSAIGTGLESSNKPIIKHLQACRLQLLDNIQGIHPLLKVETYYATVYLRVADKDTFFDLLAALVFWTSLKDKGIFNKCSVIQPIFPSQQEPAPLLVCRFNVYSCIPKNKNVSLKNNIPKPPLLDGQSASEELGWFSAMGKLSSDGKLDLLLQSDGAILWSFDVTELLRSEIQILDPCLLQNDNFLYLGIIPKLRDQLKLSTNSSFLVVSQKDKFNWHGIVLQFPLRIDLEDWFVALSSFAKVETLSLIGTDKSNELRISNRFKISILEADFSAINLTNFDNETQQETPSELYAQISIWDHCWARTSIVSDAKSPFWREEFDFNFSVKTSPVRIKVMLAVEGTRSYSAHDRVLGVIEVTQEMINDGSLNAETRIPIFDAENKHFQLGTLCIKVASSLNAILPSVNFSKLESMLSRMSLTKMTDYLYDMSIAEYLKLEDLSMVFLDIFQTLDRTNDWFQALIDKEFDALDTTITKNAIKNLSSANIYSSLFRGNSILTKSIEKYFSRVGQEYLEKAIGGTIRKIVFSDMCLELDPNRIGEEDPQHKQGIIRGNYTRLLKLAEELWARIYKTSNDLPFGIKEQLKAVRKNLEIIYKDDEPRITINCVSSFLFLRFFCPVILSPKLFHIVENHPEDGPKRTLTLLAKVLLNLSNLALFGKKEPWMTEMNAFISKHEVELIDYIDKVTNKKLDFSTKTLKLSSSVARPKIALSPNCRNELPTNPYLIDKYLRETELISVLAISRRHKDKQYEGPSSISMNRLSKDHPSSVPSPTIGPPGPKIGELEFEKLTENNAEIFGDDLLKYLAIDSQGSPAEGKSSGSRAVVDLTKTLEQESVLLYHRLEHLTQVLSDYEQPNEIILGKAEFALYLVDHLFLDEQLNVKLDLTGSYSKYDGASKLCSNSSSFTKMLIRRQSPLVGKHFSQSHRSGTKSSSSNLASSHKKVTGSIDSKAHEKSGFKFLRLFKK